MQGHGVEEEFSRERKGRRTISANGQVYIYSTSHLLAVCDTRSICKQCKGDLSSKFPSSGLFTIPKDKEINLSYGMDRL